MCPEPAEPPLASAAADGAPIRLTFLNHAAFPVKLYFAAAGGEQAEMAIVPGNGQALTFDTRVSHAWAAKSYSGVTLLELPPGAATSSRTVDIHECDLESASRRLAGQGESSPREESASRKTQLTTGAPRCNRRGHGGWEGRGEGGGGGGSGGGDGGAIKMAAVGGKLHFRKEMQ